MSQNKTLSAFSLSPIPQVLTLNKFLIELNKKLVQSSVNRFHYCIVKELLFSEDFCQRFD